MRITLFAHGTRGDVWPLVALGWHLAARDHDVVVAAPEEFREFTERAGLRAASLPFDMVAWLSTTEGQRLLHAGGVRVMREAAREYSRHADAFDEAYLAAARGAEALVGTFLTWDRALVLGDLLRIPVAAVYQQLYAPSREYSSVVLTSGRLRPRLLRLASHELTDRIWWHGTAKSTNAFRRKLGLPACSQSTFSRLQRAGALGLHTHSPSLFPRPTDWPEHLKFTGAWQMPHASRENLGEHLAPDLQAWLDAGEQPIFLGFGSMPVLDPQPLLQDIISVTAALGLRAIVSANCVSPQAADTLPDHLRVVGTVDHDRLFPQCAAVVHHGGAGSTSASLRAGRPTMICSILADQPWWGERMRHLGVGAHVPFRKLNRDTLQSGLRTLLDPDVDARARTLGAAIQAEGDGLPAATQLLEDWLVVAEPTPLPAPGRTRRGTTSNDNAPIKRNVVATMPMASRSIDDLPGPPRLPLVGNTHQLMRSSRVHLVAERWARRYGPIIRVKIGPRLMVAVSDADAINEILRARPDGFRR
jgi:sterol 3beta-glucosyltransferase